ncbi:EndoU domain-containing protein, partial [Burkholderia sp. R-70211]|nr:EndoU domain-containing protein [Burkholderia sp. R-70211]
GDQFASAGRGAENLANQFAALVNANGPQGPYVDPNDLGGPGGNSKPPAAGGSAALVPVCAVPPLCAAVPVVTPGYVQSNATLNNGNSGNEGGDASNDVNLASPDRTTHILTGDSTGGGHQWPGGPGKSVFPESWPASKIMDTVSDIATDPSLPETVQANGRIVKNGSRDGIDIRVVIEPASKGGGIVTAFPTNVPRNPK